MSAETTHLHPVRPEYLRRGTPVDYRDRPAWVTCDHCGHTYSAVEEQCTRCGTAASPPAADDGPDRPTHGGARPGAGRKPLPPGDRRVKRNITMDPTTPARLDALAERHGLSGRGAAIEWMLEVIVSKWGAE